MGPVALLQKLPMAPRTKLKMLAIKYVAEDRTLENASDFSNLFAAIRASINSQRTASTTNRDADLAQATDEQNSENARCTAEQERTVASMILRHDNLVSEKSQSDARLANAQAEEAAAREERDVACAAADAAEALLAEQIPILQKAHDDCDAAADAEFASCQATADGEINTCTTYLDTERRTIEKIQAINANLGSQQVAGAALLQAAGRFIRHVAKRTSKMRQLTSL